MNLPEPLIVFLTNFYSLYYLLRYQAKPKPTTIPSANIYNSFL